MILLVAAAAATISAAIITEQNDLLTYPPNYATFRGTSAAPGIDSCWIPYGTYSGGTGAVEYLRVTSNLIGVVASAFDGLRERTALPFSSGIEVFDDYAKLLLIPSRAGFAPGSDNGEFLASATNNTLRLLDLLNADYLISFNQYGSNYSYHATAGWIEESLAHENTSYSFVFHDGAAARFGSRNLDALVAINGASVNPPIGTEWTTDLPFSKADSNEWVSVWPVYASLTNDIHFFGASTNDDCRYFRRHFSGYFIPSASSDGWFNPSHLTSVWGDDVFGEIGDGTGLDLLRALDSMPLDFDMEDVLSVDTGWMYEVPPVETGSYWTVSGPLGNFKLGMFYEYGDNLVLWDNWEAPYPTNYYVEISYNGSGDYTLDFFDAPTSENVFQQTVRGDEDSDVLYFDGYHAQRTRLYSSQDDYEHWRNMTRRLDWKRLGIICHFERQMEQTYRARDDEDFLPFQRQTGTRDHVYTGLITVPTIDGDGNMVLTTNFNTIGVSYTLQTQIVEVATTNIGWCFPTARLVGAYETGRLDGSIHNYSPVYAAASQFETLLDSVGELAVDSEGLSDGHLIIEISGSFTVNLDTEFKWDWGINWAQFTPASSQSTIYFYPSATETESFTATANFPSNVVCNLVMDVGKRAQILQTDGNDMANTVKNFVHYPSTNTWLRSWVGEQDRPALEVMIDAKGNDFASYAAVEDDSTMNWDDIKSGYLTRRAFRMSPVSEPEATIQDSDYNRWQQLQSLDQSVEDRFAALSGMAIGAAVQNLIAFASGEESALKNQLAAQQIQFQATLRPAHAGTSVSLIAICEMQIDQAGGSMGASILSLFWAWREEEGSDPQYDDVAQVGSDYLLGGYSFGLSSLNLTNQVINVQPVRVDGHQDQMINTLWRFKNLRDPTL